MALFCLLAAASLASEDPLRASVGGPAARAGTTLTFQLPDLADQRMVKATITVRSGSATTAMIGTTTLHHGSRAPTRAVRDPLARIPRLFDQTLHITVTP